MKFLILTILFSFFLTGIWLQARAARFDWTLGEPSVVEDITSGTSDDDTRYDWTLGQPDTVFDATFVADTGVTAGDIHININGLVNVNGIVNVGN